MSKLGRISDFLITRALLFMTAFVWTRFFVRNIFACAFLSAAITFAMCLIFDALTVKHRAKKESTRTRIKRCTETLEQFIYGGAEYTLGFFYNMLSAKHKCDRAANGCLVVDESVAVFPRLGFAPVGAGELNGIILAAATLGLDKIVVLAPDFAPQARRVPLFHSGFEIELYDADQTFALLERFDCFPAVVFKNRDARLKISAILPFAFSRGKAKGYALAALTMFGGCLFLPFRIYYGIMTTLLLIAALLSHKEVFAPRGAVKDKLI